MSQKFKINTPTDEVVAQASAETTVTDARGRVLTMKKPGVLANFRLVELLGDTASNAVYRMMILPIIYVTAIDDDPVFYRTKRELDALIQRLDEDGLEAATLGLKEHFGINLLASPEELEAQALELAAKDKDAKKQLKK